MKTPFVTCYAAGLGIDATQGQGAGARFYRACQHRRARAAVGRGAAIGTDRERERIADGIREGEIVVAGEAAEIGLGQIGKAHVAVAIVIAQCAAGQRIGVGDEEGAALDRGRTGVGIRTREGERAGADLDRAIRLS